MGEISGENLRVDIKLSLHFVGEAPQQRLSPCHENKVIALRGETAGEDRTDPARRPGD